MKKIIFNISDVKELLDEICDKAKFTGRWYDPRYGRMKDLEMEAFEDGYGFIYIMELEFKKDEETFTGLAEITNETFTFMRDTSDDYYSSHITNYEVASIYDELWQMILFKNHPKEMASFLIEKKQKEISKLEQEKLVEEHNLERSKERLQKRIDAFPALMATFDKKIANCQEEINNLATIYGVSVSGTEQEKGE